MLQTLNASAIIDDLKEQARQTLSAALGTKELESFAVGKLGLFPYYYEDSKDISLFNNGTYNWINAALKPGTHPKEQAGIFANEFDTLVTKIGFRYSKTDQATVNKAAQDTANQAANLQSVWQANIGAFPSGSGQPTDRILTEIQTKWCAADKPVTLMDLQTAPNLRAMLPNAPASGMPVLQSLGNYLNALGGAIGLINDSTMSQGILQTILNHLNMPSTDPEATKVSSTTAGGAAVAMPGYKMGAALGTIKNELANSGSAVTLSMTVSRSSASQFQVSVSGKAGITIPVFDFLTVSVGNKSSYFEDEIATSSNTTSVDMTFPGVCYVPFGPKDLSISAPRTGWFYMDPITQAVENQGRDVTGYHFDAPLAIDLTSSGGFGFVEGVAVSAYPTITIKVTSANYQKIEQQMKTSTSFGISFVGIPIGAKGSASTYSSKVSSDASSQTVTITLEPPSMQNPVALNDSTAWILGAVINHPAVT